MKVAVYATCPAAAVLCSCARHLSALIPSVSDPLSVTLRHAFPPVMPCSLPLLSVPSFAVTLFLCCQSQSAVSPRYSTQVAPSTRMCLQAAAPCDSPVPMKMTGDLVAATADSACGLPCTHPCHPSPQVRFPSLPVLSIRCSAVSPFLCCQYVPLLRLSATVHRQLKLTHQRPQCLHAAPCSLTSTNEDDG
jgi:hypothetical protein